MQIIELEAQLPLANSGSNDGITGNTSGEGQDDIDFESINKGWNSYSWTSDKE